MRYDRGMVKETRLGKVNHVNLGRRRQEIECFCMLQLCLSDTPSRTAEPLRDPPRYATTGFDQLADQASSRSAEGLKPSPRYAAKAKTKLLCFKIKTRSRTRFSWFLSRFWTGN